VYCFLEPYYLVFFFNKMGFLKLLHNAHALPPVTRTLPQGELLHRALVSAAARLGFGGHQQVTGLDDSGRPLAGHRHTHVLHLDLDGDGHLDHVLLWAPGLLDARAQQAVRAVRTTFSKGGAGPLSLSVAATGTRAEVARLPGALGDALARIVGPARRWTSCTPFVAPRFVKARGSNTLEGQIAAELASRGLPVAESIEVLAASADASKRLRHYVRARRGGPQPPVDCGYEVRVSFGVPVTGPLCLGYGAHFGLGRFEHEAHGGDERTVGS